MLIAIGCKEKPRIDSSLIQNINVDLDNIEEIRYSDIYKGIRYIKLETNENNLLGFVNKICISDNRLYLLSPTPINTVYVFKMDGKFLYKLRKIGKGPGEYTDLQDIQVNKYIWLLDHFSKKILKYSLDGKFLCEISTKVWADRFEFLNKDTIVFFSNNRYNEINNKIVNYQLIFMDLASQEIVNYLLPFNPNFDKVYVRDYTNFSSGNQFISFNHSYNDTIFRVNPGMQVSPRYHVDFGKYKVPDELLNKKYNNAKEFSMSIARSDYVYRFGSNFRENENVLFFCFVHKRILHHLLVSKKTENIICYNNFINDLEGYNLSKALGIDFQPLAATEKELVFLLEPQEFISSIEEQKKIFNENEWLNFKENNQNLIDVFQKTKSMDNPIIVYYETKSF